MSSTAPATRTILTPATEEEIRHILKPLFSQFPTQDGDSAGKILGYLVALQGQPAWSIEETARSFLAGKVQDQSRRFMPTSAEFADECRRITDQAVDRATTNARFKGRVAVRSLRPFPKSDWRRSFPGLLRIAAWNLPAGAIITAADASVTMPDGQRVSWSAFEHPVGSGSHDGPLPAGVTERMDAVRQEIAAKRAAAAAAASEAERDQ